MKTRPEATSQLDANLVSDIARGDEAALAVLYDRYAAILFGVITRILSNRAEAEDVLQETFLQIWQQANNYDQERGRAFTWMVTMARSRAIDRLRHLETRGRTEARAAHETDLAADHNGVEVARLADQREIVRKALGEIPEAQRRPLLLAYFEGLTQSQIAERMGEPIGTVKTRTRAGLKRLHDALRDHLREWH